MKNYDKWHMVYSIPDQKYYVVDDPYYLEYNAVTNEFKWNDIRNKDINCGWFTFEYLDKPNPPLHFKKLMYWCKQLKKPEEDITIVYYSVCDT